VPLRAHLRLLVQGLAVWGGFWLAGLPDYYQQHSTRAMAVGCILLSVAVGLVALHVRGRGHPATRHTRARWIAFYFTVPFAVLDAAYCGVHLGHGFGFLGRYWYLTVFYVTPWLTFPPTALLLDRMGDVRARRSRD
jgi:hypothetical protein